MPEYSERRLKRALEHVNTFWLPIQEPNLQEIKNAIHESDYELVKQHLLLDPWLYLHICRAQAKDGIEIYDGPCLFRVEKYIPENSKAVSPYSLDAAGDLQLVKQKEISLVLSAILELTKNSKFDQQEVYLISLLRSLGMQLISWNYSNIFAEALTVMRPTEDIETVLTRMLGFSPTMLASRLIGSWGLKNDIMDIAFLNKETAITEICRIGETLARINCPQIYPTAKKEWDFIKKEIEKKLGQNGLSRIQSCYETLIRNINIPNIDLTNIQFEGAVKFIAPDFVGSLSYDIKNQINSFYGSLNNYTTFEALRCVTERIFPLTDFLGLAVFTLDPINQKLIRQCKVGEILSGKNEVDLHHLDLTDSFSKSLSLTEEVITGSLFNHDNPRSFLLLNLYVKNSNVKFTFGTLYLEGDFLLSTDSLKFKKLQAKALREAIVDSLHL